MGFIRRFFKRKFREKGFFGPEEEADNLVQSAIGSAYKIFLDGGFRKMIGFERQSEEEQNRLFNELTVTSLVLLKMLLEDDVRRMPFEKQEFWRKVEAAAPEQFFNFLGGLKIPQKHTRLWRELFDLRLNETKENEGDTRNVWAEELIKSQNDALDEATVRVATIAVSALLHLRRGKSPADDPLHHFIRDWCISLNNKLAKSIGW